jgi:Fe-S-cluster containining protein
MLILGTSKLDVLSGLHQLLQRKYQEDWLMENLRKDQAISYHAENPRQWLAAYLHNRAYLATYKSDFLCDPTCTRPGCKNIDLQVPVSIIDLVGAAMHRDKSVSTIYHNNYSLGLLSNEREDWIKIVTLRLKKPCPFLENDRCSIYPVRPLPCILFPEYLVNEGTFEANARKDHFKDYLCFHGPIPLSPDRARVIVQLKRMWERESLISNFYLFNHGLCHIDFSNLIKELSNEGRSRREAESEGKLEPVRVIPSQVIEHFFLKHIAKCQPFAEVNEKINRLNTREGQVESLQFLQDDLLMKKLKKCVNDRALVFRFVNGKLQAKRRSLSPLEYKFY